MGGTDGTGSRGWREVFTAEGDSVIKDEVIPNNLGNSYLIMPAIIKERIS